MDPRINGYANAQRHSVWNERVRRRPAGETRHRPGPRSEV
jgi:hypothetical protein